jgi:deazaflavin-dependent oxidoreductase (nitroreductase family)
MTTTPHYRAPGAVTRHVMNPLVAWMTRRGLRAWGARTLEVTGRRSGQVRTTPVNVLDLAGTEYLVAPRGTTDWVRNVRAADGRASLRSGRSRRAVVAVELTDAEKPPVLRAYLARWRWEVGQFFDGVGPDATDEELLAVADRHPVFRLADAPASAAADQASSTVSAMFG